MKRIPCRLFTEEFKREAIKLVTEQNLNIAQAGRQLDNDPKSIRAWIAQAERGELKATLGAAKLTADQQRIRELEDYAPLSPLKPPMRADALSTAHSRFKPSWQHKASW